MRQNYYEKKIVENSYIFEFIYLYRYDLSAKTKANSTIWIDVFGDIKFIRSLRLSCAIKTCLSSNDIDDIVNDIHIMMNKKMPEDPSGG